MNSYYSRRARFHDEYMNYTGNAAMEKLMAPLISIVGPHIENKEILEIACGTGNWTEVLTRRARTVLATDAFDEYLQIARTKEYPEGVVTFKKCDAYRLNEIQDQFSAAFSADWFSHIPRQLIPKFLRGLNERLLPGSPIIIIDMLSRPELEAEFSHLDIDGNRICRRTLPDGGAYLVVKNFPSEVELRTCLDGFATDFEFFEDSALKRWVLICRSV